VNRNGVAISGKWADCDPGCPGVYNPYPTPAPRPPPPPPGSEGYVRFRNGGKRQGIPEVYLNGYGYKPICGHFFWNNNNGADLFCQKLNYKRPYGQIISKFDTLQDDAVQIGECRSRDRWFYCSGSCNSKQVGAVCKAGAIDGYCNRGSSGGFQIRCSKNRQQNNGGRNTKKVALSNGIPYVKTQSTWWPICGHYFWDNDVGAELFL